MEASEINDKEENDAATPIEHSHLPSLLRLPLEILQLIQLHMNVATFFISLLVSKRFLVAAESRPVILHHLQRIPGLGLGLDDLNNEKLLSVFRRRAAESGQAAGVLARTAVYEIRAGCFMSRSAFTSHDPVQPELKPLTLAVPHSSGVIQLYKLKEYHVQQSQELHIRHEDGNPNRMDILKLAFAPDSGDLGVLCYQKGSKAHRNNGPSTPKSLEEDYAYYKMVVFHSLYARQKGHFYSSYQQETRDIELPSYCKPQDIALAPNGMACICLYDEREENGLNVRLICRDSAFMQCRTYDPNPRWSFLVGSIGTDAILGANFIEGGRKLELFRSGHHIPSFYSNITLAGNQESSRVHPTGHTFNLHKDGRRQTFSIATPFYERHQNAEEMDWNPDPKCVISKLALGIAENKKDDLYHCHGIFIMQAEKFESAWECDHSLSYDSGRSSNLRWKPVALLAGYKQGHSTLGTVAAISPCGTRIAAAIWKRVYLWFLDPNLLLDGDLHLYFPVRDFNQKKGFGRLRPTLLSITEGVVHNILWTSEQILFAITVSNSRSLYCPCYTTTLHHQGIFQSEEDRSIVCICSARVY